MGKGKGGREEERRGKEAGNGREGEGRKGRRSGKWIEKGREEKGQGKGMNTC